MLKSANQTGKPIYQLVLIIFADRHKSPRKMVTNKFWPGDSLRPRDDHVMNKMANGTVCRLYVDLLCLSRSDHRITPWFSKWTKSSAAVWNLKKTDMAWRDVDLFLVWSTWSSSTDMDIYRTYAVCTDHTSLISRHRRPLLPLRQLRQLTY